MVIRWTGNCEHDRIEELRESVAACNPGSDVSIDLSRVAKIDSAALALLIGVQRKALPGRVRLIGAHTQVRAMLVRTGLNGFFDVDPLQAA